ncbi:MAG: sterol carrier family protein [Propionibacteriaceae bacterium]
MAKAMTNPAEALFEQSRTVLAWLRSLPESDFARPTVLPEWDVRHLTGHLVVIHAGFLAALDRPSRSAPVPVHELVRRYRRDVDQINAMAADATGAASGAELLAQLADAIDALSERLLGSGSLPPVVETPRGAGALTDFVGTRVVDVVVHADDLSRSLSDRPPIQLHRRALSVCSRTLATILAGQHPGRSIEVRIPPFAAVQCGIGDPGPTHTRGTPPNVVETDAVTFLRMATGRTTWEESVQTGRVAASGLRADLSGALPLLS